jgi:predicted  nucleic acid-binding Zn-ribbon protein
LFLARQNLQGRKRDKVTTAELAIESFEAEIIRLQIAIAQERERGGEMAEGTRLWKIADLRSEIEFCQENAAAVNDLESEN